MSDSQLLWGNEFLKFKNGSDVNHNFKFSAMQIKHNEAPPHFNQAVKTYPIHPFPGRVSPQHWPPRSPDFNALEFYMQTRMKNIVYQLEMHWSVAFWILHHAQSKILMKWCNQHAWFTEKKQNVYWGWGWSFRATVVHLGMKILCKFLFNYVEFLITKCNLSPDSL
jgi:hypothetical protein